MIAFTPLLFGVLALSSLLSAEVTRYVNGRLLRQHTLVLEELWVENGKIIAPKEQTDNTVDVEGAIIAPGYIDLQINGGFGVDFTSEPEKAEQAAIGLLAHGVTAFLPTLISTTSDHYRRALPLLQPNFGSATSGATRLGIHLEGPFFNPKQKGAHTLDLIQSCKEPLEELYGPLTGVKIVTLAPEIDGALPAISRLCQQQIIVSVGHSNATYQQMEQALQRGATLCTHLFNAMAPLHHREPGIVGTALTNSSLYYSIIADGHHVAPTTILLAWRANPEGLLLVTDAIEALGLSEGHYHLGDRHVEVAKGRALIAGTETLAGSVLSLDAAVRNLCAFTHCSIPAALECATLKPATLLGIESQKGTLQIGADADFVLLNEALEVQATFIGGQPVWSLLD